jgi:O-antigen/teichoic acid export membrane protein
MGATYVVALGTSIVKKSGPVALSIFIGAVVNTVLNFALIPRLGRDGAAIATFTAYLAAAAYLYWASQASYPIPYRPFDALACLGLSALLIGLDHFFLPPTGFGIYLLRAGMCLLFVPLAFALRIVVPDHVRQFCSYVSQRVNHARPRPGQAM